MNPIIRMVEIEKSFSLNHIAVHPLSLQIDEGEFLTFLGPSGCGKTTLLRMIAGLEQPGAGQILLEGKQITNLPPYQRDVNLVFQNYALFPHLTVEQNIRFGLQMKKIPPREQQSRVEEVLGITQLTELGKRYPHQISGGQQQRTAIARAIVCKPKVLLLDEPLAALDLQLRKRLQLELKQLQRSLGMTFVYVTHDQEEALAMSDRIAVMNQGRIEQMGTPGEIYNAPQSLFVATFIGENNIFQKNGKYLAVRPEKLRLNADGETGEGRIVGTVEDVIFMGSLQKIVIRSDQDNTLWISYQLFSEGSAWRKGVKAGISWSPGDEVTLAG